MRIRMVMVTATTMMIVAVVAAACVAMISMRNRCGRGFVTTTSSSTRRQI